MGTSDAGPFANDGAADFLAEAVEAPARAVTQALRVAADAREGGYLDVDDGQAAHAAAEIVATAFGRADPAVENGAASEIAARVKPAEALRVLALRALERVAGPASEVASLWSEGAGGAAFAAQLADLRARLVDAASGPRKIARPKVGDVLEVPYEGATLVVQIVAPGEVVVFRGARGAGDDPRAIAGSREGTRTPCESAELARVGRNAGRAPVRAAFKGKRLYALEVERIERYALVNGAHKEWRWVTYEEAREHDVYLRRRLVDLGPLARGEAPARPRSPDGREAAYRRSMKGAWEKRRATTGPGPFGDPAWTGSLFTFVREHGVAGIVHHLGDAASGKTGGGDGELQLRWHYAQVGLLALWLGRWPITDLPEALRAEVPPKPEADLPTCIAGARAILARLEGRESELRMMWEEGPDGGAAFRAAIEALRAALGD